MKLEQEIWKIDKFIEYARNPRENDHAVDRISAAIREFGFRVPIIAKSDGTVVDGHLRLKAAKKLDLKELPVILADDLSETQIKAFRLSINKMAELADWDNELLILELEELQDEDYDLALTGFDEDELGALSFGDTDEVGMPDSLAEKKDYEQVTFNLHPEQVEQVQMAMTKAKGMGCKNELNENSNGNALAFICEMFITQNGASNE